MASFDTFTWQALTLVLTLLGLAGSVAFWRLRGPVAGLRMVEPLEQLAQRDDARQQNAERDDPCEHGPVDEETRHAVGASAFRRGGGLRRLGGRGGGS